MRCSCPPPVRLGSSVLSKNTASIPDAQEQALLLLHCPADFTSWDQSLPWLCINAASICRRTGSCRYCSLQGRLSYNNCQQQICLAHSQTCLKILCCLSCYFPFELELLFLQSGSSLQMLKRALNFSLFSKENAAVVAAPSIHPTLAHSVLVWSILLLSIFECLCEASRNPKISEGGTGSGTGCSQRNQRINSH